MTLTQIRNRVQTLQRRYSLAHHRHSPPPPRHPVLRSVGRRPRPEETPARDPSLRHQAGRRRHPSPHLRAPYPLFQEAPRSQHLPPAQQHRFRPLAQTRIPLHHRRHLPMGPPSPRVCPHPRSQFAHALLQPAPPVGPVCNGDLTRALPLVNHLGPRPCLLYSYPQFPPPANSDGDP